MRDLMTSEQFKAADAVRDAGAALAGSRAKVKDDLESVRQAIWNALDAGVNYRDLIVPSGMSSRYVWLIMDEHRAARERPAA